MNNSSFQIILEEIYQTILSCIKLLLISKWNIRLPGVSDGKSLYVLGNGPSLKLVLEKDIHPLTQEDLMCVNFFPMTEDYLKLKPRFFITAAPELWRKGVDNRFSERGMELFRTIRQKTNWKLDVLLPAEISKNKEIIELLSDNKNITIYYFNNTAIEGIRFFREWIYKKNLGMPRPHNVLIPSIMCGINMGYQNIYLFGADHSWLPQISIDDNNRVLINQKHFYDESTSKAKPMHKSGRGERKLYEVLMKFVYSFKAYFVIRQYADSRKSFIYNATPGSFIDAFDRVNPFNHK